MLHNDDDAASQQISNFKRVQILDAEQRDFGPLPHI